MNKQLIFSFLSIICVVSNAYGMDGNMDNSKAQLLALQGHLSVTKEKETSPVKSWRTSLVSPEFSTQQSHAPSKAPEEIVSMLTKQAILESNSLESIDIIGYPQWLESSMLRQKAELVASFVSMDAALSLNEADSANPRLVIDVSKIHSFSIDLSPEEVRLRRLQRLHADEVILVQDGKQLIATTRNKTEACNKIYEVLQAVVDHGDGKVAIDIEKLQRATIKVTPKGYCENPSVWNNVLVPVAKGTVLIGIGYLIAKYGGTSSK